MSTNRIVPRTPDVSRCPACNPFHGGTFSGTKAAKNKRSNCAVCKGTKLVPMAVAARYLHSLEEVITYHLSKEDTGGGSMF